ncbi:hypothetical protein Vretimale_18274 [Volvox reticuliferus]|uniref:Uncharacterized protein n=1 Tax=Volvox reticuliferus TaxID=1737510 RepID=A0A8J4CYV4_9CHLO|nr:hypothetical protein Vretifemale_18046 [Volvox reticuliferus]GIM15489.1 hypothetical protein Vretimale_18274 [Volvox reticuliferus]
MSRTSNRGPRADIALLRKLKADPNFSPASLLNTGPNILEKANKLKGFVEYQRGKLGASAAKTEWLLAYQQLQGDQDDAERELTTCLQQLAGQPVSDHVREMVESALVALYDDAEKCRAERHDLRSQIKELSSAHASLNAHSNPSGFSKETSVIKAEVSAAAEELEASLASLAEQAAALNLELKESWPSALAGPQSGSVGGDSTGGGLAAVAASSASDSVAQLAGYSYSYSRSDDCAELERMLARFPLASSDIKDRIREVFAALQEKFLERVETWHLESEQAARDLAVATAATAVVSTSCSNPQRRKGPATSNSTGPGKTVIATAAGRTGQSAGGGDATRAAPGRGRAGAVANGRGAAAAAVAAAARPLPDGAAAGDVRIVGREEGAAAKTAAGTAGVAGSSSSSGGGWAFAGYGGWSAEEHSAFVRHRDRLMKECGPGAKSLSREALMARIATLLPGGRTVPQLIAHDDWTTATRLLSRKRRDLNEAWDRERRQFLEDSASFLQESQTLFFAQAEEAANRLVAELQRVRARDELEELRAEKAREDEVATAERAAREAAEAETRLLEEARERRERAAKKEMVAAYRAELERQQAAQQAAAAEADRLAALAAEQQAEYNRQRVEVRQAEYVARQEQARERQAVVEAEMLAREARLARLRALVAPEVEADPKRLLAPTAASAAVDPDKDAEGAFHPVNGFTTDQVVKDQRFKVFEALAVLGLHETTYGRQAIAAAQPARPTRPDNFTTEQREAMVRR